MKNSKIFANIFILAFFVSMLSISYLISLQTEKPPLFVTKQQSSLNLDNKLLNYINLGQKRLISSLLWIATILESDHDHYKERDLNSWMFLRFNSISLLEPKFKETYTFGGTYLSIVKDNLQGASIIYDKGLLQYPDEYVLLRDAGFHYYFEIGDFQKAFVIYRKLKNFSESTPIMISTLARLESQSGNLDDAYNLLLSRYNQIPDKDSAVAKKILINLYAIKAERDLNCLNSSATATKCDQLDLEGNPYILNNNIYVAAKKWTPLRIKTRAKK